MPKFAATELILTNENRVYHLNLKNEDVANDVILVGDQNRVAQISKYFDKIDFKTTHREFITHTGFYNGKRITVTSTGIGTDNIDIVMNELDAAVNIDPIKRELNHTIRQLNIYRLGTSGGLQAHIPVNGLVASTHGLGLDGLLNFYEGVEAINIDAISDSFIQHLNWPNKLPYPYCIAANEELLKKFEDKTIFKGITATAPGFYGPQGREIRLKTTIPNLNNLLNTFISNNLQITNFEMETSALYGLGKLLGHNCLTICVIIANRMRKEFTDDYSKSVEVLIESSLNKISDIK
jgi:uridine phosphorylase